MLNREMHPGRYCREQKTKDEKEDDDEFSWLEINGMIKREWRRTSQVEKEITIWVEKGTK